MLKISPHNFFHQLFSGDSEKKIQDMHIWLVTE